MLAGIEDSEREDEVFIPYSRVIVIVALLCFTVGAQQAAFPQEGQSPDDLFKNLSASVFRVEGLDRDEGWELLGSAVAVRPNVLVTNWHIIEAAGATLTCTHRFRWMRVCLATASRLETHTGSHVEKRWCPVADRGFGCRARWIG